MLSSSRAHTALLEDVCSIPSTYVRQLMTASSLLRRYLNIHVHVHALRHTHVHVLILRYTYTDKKF